MRTKRPGIVIALFSLVLTIWATSAILDLVRREVQSAATRAIDAAQSIVFGATGLNLNYDYISFDSINTFSAHNIQLYRQGSAEGTDSHHGPARGDSQSSTMPSEAPLATIDKISLRISYWALLSGQSNEVLRDISATNFNVFLSIPDDDSTLNKIIETLSKPGAAAAPRFDLSISPLHVDLVDRSGVSPADTQVKNAPHASLSIDTLQFSTLTGIPVINAPSISIESGGVFGMPSDMSVKLGLQGSGSSDFSTLSLTMSASARTPSWLLMPQRVVLKKTGDRVELTREGGGLEVRGRYEGGRWQVEGDMAGYRGGKDVEVGGELGALLGGVAMKGKVSVEGEGVKVGRYAVDVRGVVDAGVKVGSVDIGGMEAALKGDGDGLMYQGNVGARLQGYEFGYGGELAYSGLRLKGSFIARGNGIDTAGGIDGGNGAYRISLTRGNVGDISVSKMGYAVGVEYAKGEVGVRVGEKLVGSVKVGAKVEGEVMLKGLGGGVGKGVVWLDGGLTGWYEGGDWGVSLGELGVRYEGEGVYPTLQVSGDVGPKGAVLSLDSIVYNNKEFKGTINAQYASLLNSLQNSKAAFTIASAENERVKVQGEINAENGKIDASIEAASIPIEQIAPASWKMIGDIQVQGKATILAQTDGKFGIENISLADLQIATQKSEIGGIPFNAAASLKFKDNSISIDSGNFTYQNYKIENMQANYDVTSKKLQYSMNTKEVFANQLLNAHVTGKGSLDGAVSELLTKANAQFSGEIADAKLNSLTIDPIAYTLNVAGADIDLEMTQSGDSRTHVAIKDMSEFEVTIQHMFDITGTAKGTIQSNSIQADVDLEKMNLSALQLFISPEDIKGFSGTVSASVQMSGDISDPKINGKIQLNNAAFSSNLYLLEKVGPFNTEISITDGAVELSPTIINIGSGKISVAATGSLARWEISDITAFISTQQTAALQFKGTIAGLTAKDIQIKADVKANISQGKLELGGNLLLDNGTLEVNPEGFAASDNPTPSKHPLLLNLDLSLGKNVELYLPSQDLPLVRGMSSPNSALNILYDEASGAFSINGKVELRSGYVLYLLRNFFIKQCAIDFAENQTKFNPLISATAELRELSRDGTINITLSANRLPFEDFKPQLSSVPPKSETELLALLGGGLALLSPSSTNPLTIREAVIAGSEFLTQNSIFRSFEQRVQKTLGLDALYIQSSFIQRWLLDITDPSHTGNTPLSAYLAGTELFAGKYITDSAFAHFTLSMAQNPLEKLGALQLDSELGLELQSPFGLLQWGLSFGKQGTPLNNQTISLSWRINY